jgi:hypothetical protein
MRHLSDAELVDAAERALTPARSVHLDSCDRCRAAVDRLASTLRDAAAVDMPEPSPLFWDHFSARVHDAVAAEQRPAIRSAWTALWTPWMPIVAFCMVVIAIVSAAWFARPSPETVPASTVASAISSSPETHGAADDPAWADLRAVAAAVNVDEDSSAGLTVRPAAIDNAVQQLTPQERMELRRLLQSEMKRSSD